MHFASLVQADCNGDPVAQNGGGLGATDACAEHDGDLAIGQIQRLGEFLLAGAQRGPNAGEGGDGGGEQGEQQDEA